MDTFPLTETPDWGLNEDTEADMDEVKMGDGYVLRRPKGINYLKDSWSPSWGSLEGTAAKDTQKWLKTRLNRIPFLWLHPVENVTKQVICTKVQLTYNQYNDTILNATFEEDFNPA